MIRQWLWRTTLTPEDVFRHPWDWAQISAAEAAAQSRWAPVVVVTRTATGEQAAWYEDHISFSRGSGPPSRREQFFQFIGGIPQSPAAAVHATTDAEPEEQEEALPPDGIINPFADDDEHWIEVQLIDPSGDPVPDEEVIIEDTDGLPVGEGRTDADGVFRLELFTPDTYKIIFPSLEKHDYKRVS
jgi:hypothetical protein